MWRIFGCRACLDPYRMDMGENLWPENGGIQYLGNRIPVPNERSRGRFCAYRPLAAPCGNTRTFNPVKAGRIRLYIQYGSIVIGVNKGNSNNSHKSLVAHATKGEVTVMSEFIEDLKQTNLFFHMETQEIDGLLHCLCQKYVRYAKGDYIVEKGRGYTISELCYQGMGVFFITF